MMQIHQLKWLNNVRGTCSVHRGKRYGCKVAAAKHHHVGDKGIEK
jgi:hypothetical protein